MKICHCFLPILGLIFTLFIHAQSLPPQREDIAPTQDNLPLLISSKYLDNISSKADQLEQKLDKQSTKALQQMYKLEEKIKTRLAKKDSLKSDAIFSNAKQQYKQLEQRLQNQTSLQQYLPALDSVATSLKFLQQNPQLLSNAKEAQQKLKEAMSKLSGMEGKLQKAEEIKVFLKARQEFLKKELNDLGFAKELKKLHKQSFYFGQQLAEYKLLLKDRKKAERKALALLKKSKLFQKFMLKHSRLASLFRLPDPDNPISQASLAGLQTRATVNNLIQQQIATGGPNAQQQFQQNIQQAQSQLNELKNKLNQFGGSGSSDDELPDFKVNKQRKKNFWKKWEVSINAQSNKPNSFFPVTTDLSMMAGFKPHDGYVVGVGIGGLIGWGKDIRHIDISSQGMSIKSFVEIKIKGSFHFAGGYEMNYRSEIKRIEELKNYNSWTRSGLAGISKIVSVKSKFFKKAKLSLMWDFLSYSQVPKVNPPVVFRIGYSFK